MERQGWIDRVRDPHNRKRIRVNITREGTERLEQIRNLPELRRRFESDPLGCMDRDELQWLTDVLNRIHNHDINKIHQRVRDLANDES